MDNSNVIANGANDDIKGPAVFNAVIRQREANANMLADAIGEIEVRNQRIASLEAQLNDPEALKAQIARLEAAKKEKGGTPGVPPLPEEKPKLASVEKK